MKVNSLSRVRNQTINNRISRWIYKCIGSWIIVTFDSKNSLIRVLDDEYKESDEEVPNLITPSTIVVVKIC